MGELREIAREAMAIADEATDAIVHNLHLDLSVTLALADFIEERREPFAFFARDLGRDRHAKNR